MLKKRYIISIIGGLAMAVVALAQDAGTVAPTTQTPTAAPRQELRTQVQTQRTELRTNLQVQRDAVRAKVEVDRESFQAEARTKLQNIRTAIPEEREKIREDLKTERETLRESVKAERETLRENSKQLRDEFREKVKTDRDRARIAAAHGRGLKMLNRYRAAIARFDHLTQRIEARVEKVKARGVDVSTVIPLIEEAKNMQVEAEADLEAMKAKYEDLLKGVNTGGVAEEAKTIAETLKIKIEAFHNKLKEIARALRVITPPEAAEANESANVSVTETSNTQ